jgi:hypothetical protein
MKRVTQMNSLRRGELSGLEASAPLTKAYIQGGEEVRGFDISSEGLAPMKIPVASEGKDFEYLTNSYRGKYYISNSVVASGTVAAIPTEAGMLYKALDSKVGTLISSAMRATPTDTSASDYLDYRDAGKWDIDRTLSTGKLIDGAASADDRTVIITRKTTIYRAFWPCKAIGEGTSDVTGSWGIHAKRRVVKTDWDTNLFGGTESYHNYDDTYYGCARGSGYAVRVETKDGYLEKNNARSEQWLELLSIELPPGVYRFTGDIYLVGKAKMFKTAPQDRSYSITVTNYAANGSTTMTEDRSWCDKEDAYVMAWGGESEIVNPTTHTSAFVPPTYVKLDFPGTLSFWFTSRTIVAGSRRFGACQLEGDAEMFGATQVDAMGGSDSGDHGREVPTTSTVIASSPYCVKVHGGASWYEEVASGILIGTPSAEYVLSNHQVNPLTGGASLQKISAVGCVGKSDFRVSISANLAGDVFYLSRYGITTLDFSNEQQVYLPRNFEFRSRRFSKVTSIASSVSEACLYFVTDAGALWKLWPKTGSLALVPVSIPTGRKIIGVFSVAGDAYILAQKTVAEGNGLYTCPVAQARAEESYIRTTAFGRTPRSRTQIKRLLISGYGLKAGEYRIQGGSWTGIPLTATDVTDGFSGTKEFYVSDRPGDPGEGKTVEFRFVSQTDGGIDPGTLEAIGVEMEV